VEEHLQGDVDGGVGVIFYVHFNSVGAGVVGPDGDDVECGRGSSRSLRVQRNRDERRSGNKKEPQRGRCRGQDGGSDRVLSSESV